MPESRKSLKARINALESENGRLRSLLSGLTDDLEHVLHVIDKPIVRPCGRPIDASCYSLGTGNESI